MKTTSISHWGVCANDCPDSDHNSTAPACSRDAFASTAPRAVIVTLSGEILVARRHQHGGLVACDIALLIDRGQRGLSAAQAKSIEAAWSAAIALTDGCAEGVTLQPLPHNWRFKRSDYQTLAEWQNLSSASCSETDAGACTPVEKAAATLAFIGRRDSNHPAC
jgi:hypothetical protein